MTAAALKLRPSPSLGRYMPQGIFLAILVHVLVVIVWQMEPQTEGGGGGQVVGRMSVSLGGSGAAGPVTEVPDEAPIVEQQPIQPLVEEVAPEPEPVAEVTPPPLPVVETPRRRAVVKPPVRREVRPTPRVQERAPQRPAPTPPAPTPPQRQPDARSGDEGDGRPAGDVSAGAPTRGEGMPSQTAGRGNGDAGQINQELAYLAIVRSQIAQNRIYPAAARRRRAEGTTSVRIEIDANGHVASAVVVQESGHFQLDRAAQRMIDKAAPFPPPPTAPFRATIPIEFELR